jgi:esterase/lipase
VVYFVGPKPSAATYNNSLPRVPAGGQALENFVNHNEKNFRIKNDNEARIIWSDSTKQKTEWAVVYLHGFSASQEEGDPVHTGFSKKFGMNLYLARLAGHGLLTNEPMLDVTAENLWESAKQAYAIGKELGNKVILMATSTGATLALKLAAEFPEIAGLILYSPNIAINDSKAWMLNNPWGLQMARLIKGKYNYSRDTTALYARYWDNKYRVEAIVQLEELLESTMKESTFSAIRQPVLMLYYYRDEDNQDQVVKVSAMKRMFAQLGTPVAQKRQVAIPGAGDHVIASYIKSKDVTSVEKETERFAIEILKLKPR